MRKARFIPWAVVALILAAALAAAAAPPPPLFVAVISDTQKRDDDPFTDLQWAVQQVNRLKPQVVLMPGDLTDGGTVNQYEHFTAALNKLRVPMYPCLGNHDAGIGSWYENRCPPDQVAPRFLQYTGFPLYYHQRLGGWHLLVLSIADYQEGKLRQGALSAEQTEWLRQELAGIPSGEPVLLMCHYPMYDFPLRPEWKGLPDAESVLAAFAGKYLAYTLSGHWHTNTHTVDSQGRLHLVTGALQPGGGYRLLSTVGQDLYTAWVGRRVEEPLSLLGEVAGPGPLSVRAPSDATALVLRVHYSGGPLRARIVDAKDRAWTGILPAAPEQAQALVVLPSRWSQQLGQDSRLRLVVEALATARITRLALYTSPLSWDHYRLTAPPEPKTEHE